MQSFSKNETVPKSDLPPAFLSPARIPGREICNNFALYIIKIADFHVSKMIGLQRWPSALTHTHRDVAVSGPRFWWPPLLSHLQESCSPPLAVQGHGTGSSFISNSWPLNLISSSLYIKSTYSKLEKSLPKVPALRWKGNWNLKRLSSGNCKSCLPPLREQRGNDQFWGSSQTG